MKALVVTLLVAGGCRCGDGKKAAPPPPPPPPPAVDAAPPPVVTAPITEADRDAALVCLIELGRSRDVAFSLVDRGAPQGLVRHVVDRAIARAEVDGESPAAMVLGDAVDVYARADDREALRATFARIDTLSDASSTRFSHQAAQRTLAGMPVTDVGGQVLEVVAARAIAGDAPGAATLYDGTYPAKPLAEYERSPNVAALVALDRSKEARAEIAKAPAGDRLALVAKWLEVVLAKKQPLKEGIDVALAELAASPVDGTWRLGVRDLFANAVRRGRAAELAPVYRALRDRPDPAANPVAVLEMRYDLARAIGDTVELAALAKEPALADTIARTSGPIDAELARVAKLPRDKAAGDYAALWVRAAMEPVPAGFGPTLVRTVCPAPTPPRGPAAPPLAGAQLLLKDKSRGMRQECELHDLVITLLDAKGKKLGREVVDGSCTGACTAQEQREGQKRLDEINERIDRGEAFSSETDYNFTECVFSGPDAVEAEEVAGRQVALYPIHTIGPHDVPRVTYGVVVEACGALHLVGSLDTMYAHEFTPDQLTLRASADGRDILIDGDSSFYKGVAFRIELPSSCPGTPVGMSLPTE